MRVQIHLTNFYFERKYDDSLSDLITLWKGKDRRKKIFNNNDLESPDITFNLYPPFKMYPSVKTIFSY